MIQPLTWHEVWRNILGVEGIVGTEAPNNQEITDKVNEIIEVLNKLLEPKERLNEQKTSNAGKNTCEESRCTTGSVWPSVE